MDNENNKEKKKNKPTVDDLEAKDETEAKKRAKMSAVVHLTGTHTGATSTEAQKMQVCSQETLHEKPKENDGVNDAKSLEDLQPVATTSKTRMSRKQRRNAKKRQKRNELADSEVQEIVEDEKELRDNMKSVVQELQSVMKAEIEPFYKREIVKEEWVTGFAESTLSSALVKRETENVEEKEEVCERTDNTKSTAKKVVHEDDTKTECSIMSPKYAEIKMFEAKRDQSQTNEELATNSKYSERNAAESAYRETPHTVESSIIDHTPENQLQNTDLALKYSEEPPGDQKRVEQRDEEAFDLDEIIIVERETRQEHANIATAVPDSSPGSEESNEQSTADAKEKEQEVIKTSDELGEDEPRPKTLHPENPDIAHKFQQIMEMFDNFTKNLESLEKITLSEESPGTTKESSAEDNSAEAGAYSLEYQKALSGQKQSMQENDVTDTVIHIVDNLNISNPDVIEKIADNTDHIIDIEDLMLPETDVAVTELPKLRRELHQKPLGTKDTYTSTTTMAKSATDDNEIFVVSCETNLQTPTSKTALLSIEAAAPIDTTGAPPLVSQVTEAYNLETACKGEHLATKAVDETKLLEIKEPLPDDTKNSTDPDPVTINIVSSTSRQNLLKVRDPPSLLEMPLVSVTQPHTGPPNTIHTIHIDTTSSPTSSVMRRSPLGLRCWHVITDFFSAICMCLQVNKDCIFCLGFFIAFVVSASFLTAFFYRTLTVNPAVFQPMQPQVQSLSPINTHDGTFYYY